MNNRMKFFRNELKLTQQDIANKTGVTRQTINAIENNKYRPTLKLALKLARILM